jgi:hypothetical protein
MMQRNTIKHRCFLAAAGLSLAAGLTCRADYASEIQSLSPVNYWRLNETGPVPTPILATNQGTFGEMGNGTYIGDNRGLAGALLSDPTSTSAGFPNVNGGSGGAARVRIPWQAELNAEGAFSVEFWAKPAITAAIACPASSVDFNATTRYGWLFYQGPQSLGDGNGWFFRMYHSGGNAVAAVGIAIDTNHWYHVVGTYDGAGTISLYVDGAAAGSGAVNGTYTPNVSRTDVPLTFGGRGDGAAGNYGWGGSLDEVAYYTNALSAATVLAHYQAATNPTPSGAYATLVQAAKPAVYLRLNEAPYVSLAAVNTGTRGAIANGKYVPAASLAAGPRQPAFPTFEANNNSASFDGVTGSINCGTNASLSGTGDFSIAAWIKTSASTAGMIIQQRDLDGVVPGYNGEYMVKVNADGTVQFVIYKDNYQFDYASTTTVNDGNWHQVVVVRRGLDGFTYIDGLEAGTASGTEIRELVGAIPTHIGRDVRDSITTFDGNIDEVAIFDKALTAGTIQSLYSTSVGLALAPVLLSDPPVISPATTIYASTTFTISANIAGSLPMTYQWRKGGVVVGTSQDYTKTSATLADNGNYDVIARNAYGSVTSSVATVVINPAEPPAIVQQPVTRSVYAGGNASFTFEASGTSPLSYQWKKAGVNIVGATNRVLVITNVAAADAVTYSVGVTNVAGGILSQGATLTIRTPVAGTYEAAVVTSGPVGYWRLGEKTGSLALDAAGGNDGTITNGLVLGVSGPMPPEYPGLESSNTAYDFNAVDSYVEAGSIGLSGQITVAAWVKPNTLAGDRAIASENTSWAFKLYNTELRFTTPGILDHNSSGASLVAGVWQHVAVTFDPGLAGGARFFVNGRLVSAVTASALTKGTTRFWIGNSQWAGQIFDGTLDEVAVFNKVLSAEAIAAMYATAAYGTATAPFITSQIGAQTGVIGKGITLSVGAAGSIPLRYQWQKAGSPIPGATGSSLSFASLSYADGGSYSVTITNAAGSTNSAAALLTVKPMPTFANLTNGLRLHLRFDGSYADASGGGNDAIAPSGSPTFLAGKIGQGVHIETTPGVNYLVVGNPTSDLVFDETASFTVGYWIKYTTLFNDVPIMGNAVNSTYQLGWTFTDQGGKIEYSLVSTAGSGTYVADPVAGSPRIDNGAWHHILGVVDREKQTAFVYVDGELAGSWSIAGLGTLDTANPITIGQDPTGAYGNATFDLDDLGIWRGVLTAYDALAIYNAAQSSGHSFDVYGPVKVDIAPAGAGLIVAWQAGTLESSDDLGNPSGWTPVAGATAPNYTVAPGTGKKFYRVRL